jgi:ABC-type Fe3+ transport system substrate-binding protein
MMADRMELRSTASKRRERSSFPLGILSAGLILMVAVAGQPSAAAQFPAPTDEAALYANAKAEGGKMSYYHGEPVEQTAALIKAFEAKYPGISVEPIRLVGPVLADRFVKETQAGQNIADVLYIGDYSSAMELAKEGLVSEWNIPTYDRLPEANRHLTTAYAPEMTEATIAYNTTKVSPEEAKLLTSWKGALDPRFKGRFAVSSLACGVCYAGIQMFLTQPGYGKEFLQALADQKPAVFPSTVVALDRVVAGEKDFVVFSFETAILPRYERGAPLRWTHPDPTPFFGNMWLEVSASAPHPNTARLFVNWLTSEEGAKALLSTGSIPALKGVKDTRPVAQEPWYDPVKKPYRVDFNRWNTDYFDDMKIWTDILKGVH